MNGVFNRPGFAVWSALFLAATGVARGADEAELRMALDRFTGEWSGEVQVRALDGFVLRTVPATRRYVWQGDEQVVETTLADAAGDYVIVARQSIRLGRLQATATRPSLPEDRYVGEWVDDAIVWTNAEGNRRDAREQVVTRSDATVLESSSVEPVRGLGLSGLVRMVGEFRRSGPTEPAAKSVIADRTELESMRRAFEAERADLDGRRSEIEQLEQRAVAAESRVRELETELDESRSIAGSAAAENTKVREDGARLAAELALLRRRLDEDETRSEGVAREAVEKSAQHKELESRVTTLQAELSAAQVDRDAALRRADELQRTLADATGRLADLERSSTTAGAERESMLGQARAQLRELATQTERLSEEAASATSARDATAAELAQARAALAALEVERGAADEAKAKIAALEAALAGSNARLSAADAEVEALRTRNGVILQEKAETDARRAELERKFPELMAELAALKEAASATAAGRSHDEIDLAAAVKARTLAEELARRREAEAAELATQAAEADDSARQAVGEREEFGRRVALVQADNERLVATNARLESDRAAMERRLAELDAKLAEARAKPPAAATAPVADGANSIAAAVRDKLVGEVQQMERRVLELESERNAAREQATLLQQQADEARRLRDDTLVRFQSVIGELNALREEKERLARANLSLQAEVRSAQQAARDSAPRQAAAGGARPGVGATGPLTTADGRTADMVVAGLHVIGVTRGDNEDKAILDGRLYRNGDTVEPELGLVFERIEDNALVFRDRRGREYRRRF